MRTEIRREEWELRIHRARIRSEEELCRYWKANPAPLLADGLSYHRRYLARKRRSR